MPLLVGINFLIKKAGKVWLMAYELDNYYKNKTL
jgi:hypothetical protein